MEFRFRNSPCQLYCISHALMLFKNCYIVTLETQKSFLETVICYLLFETQNRFGNRYKL